MKKIGLRILLAVGLLALAGCGINPMEGDYGIVRWVPEERTCYDSTAVYSPVYGGEYWEVTARKCEGLGHDLDLGL